MTDANLAKFRMLFHSSHGFENMLLSTTDNDSYTGTLGTKYAKVWPFIHDIDITTSSTFSRFRPKNSIRIISLYRMKTTCLFASPCIIYNFGSGWNLSCIASICTFKSPPPQKNGNNMYYKHDISRKLSSKYMHVKVTGKARWVGMMIIGLHCHQSPRSIILLETGVWQYYKDMKNSYPVVGRI